MLDACESKLDVIKNFVPSWFAAVMGTGILAVDSLLYSAYLPILKDVAVALFYFNILLFFIFLIPWVLRWIMFKDNALADLKHPVLSAFYPTIAVGCLVLGADFINIGHDMFFGEIFWTFLTILSSSPACPPQAILAISMSDIISASGLGIKHSPRSQLINIIYNGQKNKIAGTPVNTTTISSGNPNRQ